jgi:hypothetical protein
MKDNSYEYYIWLLKKLVVENPNDAELGKKVREFINLLEEQK